MKLSSTAAACRALIVEDDARLRGMIAEYLTRNDFDVAAVGTCTGAIAKLARESFEIVVLDLTLPDGNGLDFCRELRVRGVDVGVVILSARGDDLDRVTGLDGGADDYLVKPCNPRELLARIHAVIRRSSMGATGATGAMGAMSATFGVAATGAIVAKDAMHAVAALGTERAMGTAASAGGVGGAGGLGGGVCVGSPGARAMSLIRFGRCALDPAARVLFRDGESMRLSAAEFAVLFALVSRPGQTLSRERLARLARGRGVGVHDRSIDMQIARLRKLVEDEPARPAFLRTVWGAGYAFVPDGVTEWQAGTKP